MDLFEAVACGDLEALAGLLDGGADPNPFDDELQTPLMRAAFAGHRAMVERLLKAGADPILRDKQHETALLKAAAAGHRGLLPLLSEGANEDDLSLAQTLLAHPPELLGTNPPDELSGLEDDKWSRRFATAGAWAADQLGNSDPQSRLDRLERAKKR